MNALEPRTPRILEPACEWTSEDVGDESAWTESFSESEQDELDAALRHALSVSSDVLEIEREDFPLTSLVPRLARIENELLNGRGFVRLRGIDRSRYDQHEMEMLYWGIGMHLGTPWPQNKHGHLLGDVTDQGKSLDDPTVRGNEIGGAALPFHCDGSDLVGLLCLSNGRSGGLSAVANSVTLHNQLTRESPELAAELYSPQPYDFRGEEVPGRRAWYTMPAFADWEDRLFVFCIPAYIVASQRHEDAPRLTPLAKQALRRLVELADDPRHHIAMELQPGDMQFINNYHVMHGRTAYTDDRDAGAIRHLKRLWLATRQLESRPPHLQSRVMNHWGSKRTASRMEVH